MDGDGITHEFLTRKTISHWRIVKQWVRYYHAWQRFLWTMLSEEKEKRNLCQVVFVFLSSMRELTPSNAIKWFWNFPVHTFGRMLTNADEWWTRPGRGFFYHSRQRGKNKETSSKQGSAIAWNSSWIDRILHCIQIHMIVLLFLTGFKLQWDHWRFSEVCSWFYAVYNKRSRYFQSL